MAPTPRRESVFAWLDRLGFDVASTRMTSGLRAYEQLGTWYTIGSDSAIPFGDGWDHAGAGFGDLQLLLDPLGYVHLRGAATVDLSGPGDAGGICELPDDLVPPSTMMFLVRVVALDPPGGGVAEGLRAISLNPGNVISNTQFGPTIVGTKLRGDNPWPGNLFRFEFGGVAWRRVVA